MTALLLRRARAQWPLLLSLLVVLTIGTTLLGTCTLLATRTSARAVEVAASRAPASATEVAAYTVTVSARDARSVAADTRGLLISAVAPFRAATSTRASSQMRVIPAYGDHAVGRLAEGYLSGLDDLTSRASLVAGRWPRTTTTSDGGRPGTPLESVLFDSTARLLGLTVGSRVHLGPELGRDPAAPVDVRVVGLVHPHPDAGWDRDPLHGSGYDPDPEDAAYAADVNAYGPFLVTLDDLLASGSNLNRLEVDAQPDLSAPAARDLDRLGASVTGADARLAGTLGGRVHIERVTSPLPQTLLDVRNQRELTSGSVLALALIGVVLTAIALALAGRLTTGVRAEESNLFSALGTSRVQAALIAVVEVVTLAGLAAAGAVPASSALHAALTHLPPLAGAGLVTRPVVTGAQVLAVGCGALALAVLHVGLAVRPATDFGDRGRRGLLAGTGADLLLVVLAAVGWWQLHAQPAAADPQADTVRVLAPALLLVAGSAVVLRLLPPALGWAERAAGQARGLVLPLAAFQAARRRQAYAAGLLIGLGCAIATFGTAFAATWNTSQHDQADLAVGTDLAVALSAPPAAGQGAAVAAAAGGTVSPAADQSIAVGQWLGDARGFPRLVAVDIRKGSALLRGRVDGDWGGVTKPLIPATTVTGPVLPAGAVPVVTGTAALRAPVTVTPRLLLQDDSGVRTSCTGSAVVLDGRPHPVPGCLPAAGLRLVGVVLPVTGRAGPDGGTGTVHVTMDLPGAAGPAGAWSIRAGPSQTTQINGPTVAASGSRLTVDATVGFVEPNDASRVLVATSFPAPGPVPVLVSTSFADAVGAEPGSELSLTVGTTPVRVAVRGVVASIPSEPRAPAVLTDVDLLSRALITQGDPDPPVNAWWVGNPRAGAATGAAALHIGDVTTRTAEAARLTGSPTRASLPAVMRILVAAAVLLLLGGVVLHIAYDVQLRALEVARLRGLGMSRRDIRAVLFAEHAAVLLPLIVAGALVGAFVTRVVAPLLVRSDTGAAPVPPAHAVWPWAAESALLGLLIAGCTLAVAVVVTLQARRADAAHLRVA